VRVVCVKGSKELLASNVIVEYPRLLFLSRVFNEHAVLCYCKARWNVVDLLRNLVLESASSSLEVARRHCESFQLQCNLLRGNWLRVLNKLLLRSNVATSGLLTGQLRLPGWNVILVVVVTVVLLGGRGRVVSLLLLRDRIVTSF
jgi:hypothetical protein